MLYTRNQHSTLGSLYFKNKQNHKKRSDFCLPQEMGNWMKGVKMHKVPILRWISTRDIMYNLINIIHTAIGYTWKLLRRQILRILIAMKKFFPFESMLDDGCSLNLWWLSCHGVCKSNYYAVHLKLMQCCLSIRFSIQLEAENPKCRRNLYDSI